MWLFLYITAAMNIITMKTRIYILFIIAMLSMSVVVRAQIITTIAGTGTSGFGGDGGLATAANMTQPWGLDLDPATGNIYFSDFLNRRVRKIDPSGVVTTIAGNGSAIHSGDGGPATAAGIAGPTAIKMHGTDLYIAEVYSSYVRKVDAAGNISTVAGNGVSGSTGDGGPATNASISSPNGIWVDAPGNIYICDQYTHHIRKVNSAGIISTIAGSGGSGYTGDGGAATLATMTRPDNVCVDVSGNVYFSDFDNNVVRKVSTTGIITTYAGNGIGGFSGDGGQATAAKLHGAANIQFDLSGNCYIADATNNRIRKITPAGIISTIAGTGTAGFSGDGGPALSAQLNNVNLTCPDAYGNIYVGDMFNNRLRKIVYSNIPPTFTGGASTSLTVCENAAPISINTLLAVTDPDVGQTETWSLWIAPVHGAAVVGYSTLSTGGTLLPVGLTYAPATGYAGSDSFKVRVSDGIGADTITVFVTIDPLPDTGFISGASSVCVGTSVIFSSTLAGGVWTSDAPSVASVSSGGVVAGLSIGSAAISYTITNACGTAVDTLTVLVSSSPTAFILGSTTSLCVGTTAAFTGSPAGGVWGTSSSAIVTVSGGIVGGVGGGTAIITYSITNICGSASDTQMMAVLPVPVASLSGPLSLCAGSDATYAGVPSGGIWNSGSPAVATISSSGFVSAILVGSSIISYTITNECGSATDTQILSVSPLPDAGVINVSSMICVGGSVSISNTVSGGSWTVSPFTIASINTSAGTITGNSVGSAVVTYSVPPDGHGCDNFSTQTVTVIPGLTVTDSIGNVKCFGDVGYIYLTVSNGAGPYQYTWSDGSTLSYINNLASGTYSVTISDPAAGCVATSNFNINSSPAQIALTSALTNDKCSEHLGAIDIAVTGGVSPYSFSWSNGAGTEDVFNLPVGTFSVTVRDANQCSKEFSFTIEADSCEQIVIHDVITPNGDGINDAWVIDGLRMYPNTSVTVFDKWGDAVFYADHYDNSWTGMGRNGNPIPDGTYFYFVKLPEKDSLTGKSVFTGSLLIKR